jgi:hypothetical protein
MDKWENVDAGPRQITHVERAMSALLREGATHDELTGVVGGQEHRSTLWAIMSPPRAEVVALDLAIRERYGYKITRANLAGIIGDYAEALPEAIKSRPTEDNRRTPEQDAERRAIVAKKDAEYKARQDAHDAVMAQVMVKAPAGAKALIVAEYHEDASDTQSDYYNTKVLRTVAIGFRFSSREDFRALSAAAARFPETAAVTFTEHRDNHSMGAGNYLSDHGGAHAGTGWLIRSRTLPARHADLTQDAIPDTPTPVTAGAPVTSAGGVTVRPSSIGRAGVVEIVFNEKPSDEVRDSLKAHGFRWARGNQCWYGTDTAFAESLAAAE